MKKLSLIFSLFFLAHTPCFARSTFVVEKVTDDADERAPIDRSGNTIYSYPKVEQTSLQLRERGEQSVGFIFSGMISSDATGIATAKLVLPLAKSVREKTTIRLEVSVGLLGDNEFNARVRGDLAQRPKFLSQIFDVNITTSDTSIVLPDLSALLRDAVASQGFVPGELTRIPIYLKSVEGVRHRPILFGTIDRGKVAKLVVQFTSKKDFIITNPQGTGFMSSKTLEPFEPFGANYVLDNSNHPIESYWDTDWNGLVQDLTEMRDMDLRTVRLSLAFHAYMDGPTEINEHGFEKLDAIVKLAESLGLKLDLTGLDFYDKKLIPQWYVNLSDEGRLEADAFFWAEVARRYASSPAIFCYNLQNEPVLHWGQTQEVAFGDDFADTGFYYATGHFGQTSAYVSRVMLIRNWVARLTEAIQQHDTNHLITVGMIAGVRQFSTNNLYDLIDFSSVHLYPNKNLADPVEALKAEVLYHRAYGIPIVMEEHWAMAGAETSIKFLNWSRPANGEHMLAGWLSFYWGQTPAEGFASGTLMDGARAEWLKVFLDWHAQWRKPEKPRRHNLGQKYINQNRFKR